MAAYLCLYHYMLKSVNVNVVQCTLISHSFAFIDDITD